MIPDGWRGGLVRNVVAVAGAMLASCTTPHAMPTEPEEVLFEGTLQELTPHHDGDHFVYRASVSGDIRLQVEHLTMLDAPGEFVVDLSEDGTPLGRQHLRDDGTTVWLMSEGLLQQDLIINYEQPLPSLAVPLTTTPRPARSTVTMVRGSDGKVVARGSVEQTVSARRAASPAGGAAFELRTARTVQLPNRIMRLAVTTWIAPGKGEVRSEGHAESGPPVRRELLCAIIEGKRVGDKCDRIATMDAENPS